MPLYHLKITGVVQGVAYRYHTKMQAEKLGVKGIVKNEADGSVYAEIEGEEQVLQAMVDWCRMGPATARVKHVEVSSGKERNYQDFNIIR
ncbi:MAG: acylphosphatase [Saprospiraceae bacterium]|nr:acylphosphatase [Lewinella sp.]